MNKGKAGTPLTELNDEELALELKKRKSLSQVYIGIIILMMAFAVYNATHKGSMVFSIMPLFFMPVFVAIRKNYDAAKAEQKARNRSM